jgi:serine/arginine repetitive matrix protein 1
MKKVQLEIMKPFITSKLNELMPVEDEVIIEYVFSQLEQTKNPDGKSMQIMMTGFLGKTRSKTFMTDLWKILMEAQESPYGIPRELIELTKKQQKIKEASFDF